MYSRAGQLYTALRTGCQGIKGISAGVTGFSGEKFAYMLPTRDFYMPTNLTNLHEFFFFNGENGDLFGRTNLTNAMRADDWGMSCGVVPSRHIVLGSPIRALRTRLPSLRSVVPSRHSSSPKSINVSIFVTTTGTT